MTRAILVDQHPEANAGALITSVTKLAQPLALLHRALLRRNGHAAKQSGAKKDGRRSDQRRLDVHDCLLCRLSLNSWGSILQLRFILSSR
jgi:hypothetical protein